MHFKGEVHPNSLLSESGCCSLKSEHEISSSHFQSVIDERYKQCDVCIQLPTVTSLCKSRSNRLKVGKMWGWRPPQCETLSYLSIRFLCLLNSVQGHEGLESIWAVSRERCGMPQAAGPFQGQHGETLYKQPGTLSLTPEGNLRLTEKLKCLFLIFPILFRYKTLNASLSWHWQHDAGVPVSVCIMVNWRFAHLFTCKMFLSSELTFNKLTPLHNLTCSFLEFGLYFTWNLPATKQSYSWNISATYQIVFLIWTRYLSETYQILSWYLAATYHLVSFNWTRYLIWTYQLLSCNLPGT